MGGYKGQQGWAGDVCVCVGGGGAWERGAGTGGGQLLTTTTTELDNPAFGGWVKGSQSMQQGRQKQQGAVMQCWNQEEQDAAYKARCSTQQTADPPTSPTPLPQGGGLPSMPSMPLSRPTPLVVCCS